MKVYAQPPRKKRERWLVGEIEDDALTHLTPTKVLTATGYTGIVANRWLSGRTIVDDDGKKAYLLILT